MEMLDPAYSTGWGSAWGGADEVVVVDDAEETWMMTNPNLDSMGAPDEDVATGPPSSTAGADDVTDAVANSSLGVDGPAGTGATSDADPGTEICEVCGSGADEANMLLCDSCPEGYHIYCLNPQLVAIPEGDWYCHKCEALGARTLLLEKADAISCARRWYDTQSVFGTDHGLKMDPHEAFRNSAREWSVQYSTVPPTPGQPFLIRVRYAPERQGDIWTWNAVLFTEEGASRDPDQADDSGQQQFVVESILDMQRKKKGAWEFKVKWAGYDKCSWERPQSFRDASVWKSMVAKVEAVMMQLEATEPESLSALRKSAWNIDKAVAWVTRERDEALARQLQREAGGLRQGSRRKTDDGDTGTLIAKSTSMTKTLKAAVPQLWPPHDWERGFKCDVKDEYGKWYEGTVVCVTLPRVEIRFKGFGEQFNEWKTVEPAPDEEQMQPLGTKTQAVPSPATGASAAGGGATTSGKRPRPSATTDGAPTSAALHTKRMKKSAASCTAAEHATADSRAVKPAPDSSAVTKKNTRIKKEQPSLPPEHYLQEIQGKTREQRSKHWNKQRLVPLQTACKLRGLWAGGSRAHMRDRLLAFEFERDSLTEYDLLGPVAAPASSAAPEGAVVDVHGKIEYVIERVLDMKRATDGSWRFLVKWYSFAESENSWEPAESFNSKNLWSVFTQKLLKVRDETNTDEDIALLALRNSQWDKNAAIQYVRKQQAAVATSGDGFSVQTSNRKTRIVIPEGSDSDEPDDTGRHRSIEQNAQDDQSNVVLSFRGEAITCTVCATQSAEHLRRGLCADGQVFCRRCSPPHTASTASDVPQAAEAANRQPKIPRKQADTSAVFDSGGNFGAQSQREPCNTAAVFDGGGNFGMQAQRVSSVHDVSHPGEDQPYRAARGSRHEHSHNRARDLDSSSSQSHSDASGHAATARATGVCVRAPRNPGSEFGFIQVTSGPSPTGKDLFFHRTAAFNGITVGQEVTFKMGRNKSGPIAIDVRPTTTLATVGAPPVSLSQVATQPRIEPRARSPTHTAASLRVELNAMPEERRSDSERFFLRHFNAVVRVWGQRPIESVRKANSETVERVWQCLLDGDCEDFESDICDHVAAWNLALGRNGFSDSTFQTLLSAKRRQQRESERRAGRSITGKVWSDLEGAACEIELIDKAYSMKKIVVPTRGASCGHPRCFDMKTHAQEMVKKDRRLLWNRACAKLVADFKKGLVESRADPRTLRRAADMLKCLLRTMNIANHQ